MGGLTIGDIDLTAGVPRAPLPNPRLAAILAEDIIRKERRKHEMKIGKKKLKMNDGSVRSFGSEKKRDNFEKVARAYKYGWKGPKGSK